MGRGAGSSGALIGGSGNDIASESLRFQGAQDLEHWAGSKWFLGKSSWKSMGGKAKREGIEEKRSKDPGRAVSLSPLSVTISV